MVICGIYLDHAPGTCGARILDQGADLIFSGSGLERSGGDVILVSKSAEDLLSADPVLGKVDLRWVVVILGR